MTRRDRALELRDREIVIKRDGSVCRYCGHPTSRPFIDHVYPYSKGGETSIENSVVSCQHCNARKSDKVGIWPIPLFLKENMNGWVSFVFFILGIGIITTPLGIYPWWGIPYGHFPFPIIVSGVGCFVLGIVFLGKSLNN